MHGLTLSRQPSTRFLREAEERITEHRKGTLNPEAKGDVFTGKEAEYWAANKSMSLRKK